MLECLNLCILWMLLFGVALLEMYVFGTCVAFGCLTWKKDGKHWTSVSQKQDGHWGFNFLQYWYFRARSTGNWPELGSPRSRYFLWDAFFLARYFYHSTEWNIWTKWKKTLDRDEKSWCVIGFGQTLNQSA